MSDVDNSCAVASPLESGDRAAPAAAEEPLNE